MTDTSQIKKGVGFVSVSFLWIIFIQAIFNLSVFLGQNFLASITLVIFVLSPIITNAILWYWFRKSINSHNLKVILALSLIIDLVCVYLLVGDNFGRIINDLNIKLF